MCWIPYKGSGMVRTEADLLKMPLSRIHRDLERIDSQQELEARKLKEAVEAAKAEAKSRRR